MRCYRAGKPVRDRLLDLPVRHNEWVVIDANADDLLEKGYQSVSEAIDRFYDPTSGDVYQLARRERRESETTIIETGPAATLESELAVRDLTINAMALDENDELIDPFDGEEDLQAGLLRHVTPLCRASREPAAHRDAGGAAGQMGISCGARQLRPAERDNHTGLDCGALHG